MYACAAAGSIAAPFPNHAVRGFEEIECERTKVIRLTPSSTNRAVPDLLRRYLRSEFV
jgi:hypothetical protein